MPENNLDLAKDLNFAPEKINHIHILGVCGTGMAALAGMLKSLGFNVTGSDAGVYPPMSDFLAEQKITISSPYAPENLKQKPDLVIVGNVIRKVNVEAQELAKLGIPYLSFPQALAHFFIKDKDSLVITGTHGKTTTCSLLASVLHHADLNPTFMIGGIVREFASNYLLGNGNYFVAEGDEYDTAFFDKESKFLHYQPKIAVITSLEFDHADIFDSLEDIKNSFRKFIALIPEDGLLIANFDIPDIIELAQDAKCQVQSYGEGKHLWSLGKITISNGNTEFIALKNDTVWGNMQVQLPGKHNCLNSLAVCAIMDHLGVSPEKTNKGLSAFGGVKRRQEVRGIEAGVTVIDDFAHHPTAVKETVSALKAAYEGRRLVVVFEPRTNSSRRTIFQEQYSKAFDDADITILREPVPLIDFPEDELFSSEQLMADLQKRGLKAKSLANTDEILAELNKEIVTGDVVVILSNGGFDNIHERLLQQLKGSSKNYIFQSSHAKASK
ncbi:MAG: UDP-N-acetylmuramate:L-alanyl-gamma-D-glutamyl-meso-diaminopimelate ligase [Desulfotalea sp.]